MTIINRALHKVYTRRAGEFAAGAPEKTAGDSVRGWASELRNPAPEAKSGVRDESSLSQVPAGSEVSSKLCTPGTDSGPHFAEESTQRLDGSEFPGRAWEREFAAEPVTTIVAGPVVAPNLEHSAVVDPSAAPTGSKVRIDPGHVPATRSADSDWADQESDRTIGQHWSWPAIVERLLDCPAAPGLRELASLLKHLAAEGDLRCVAFSGAGRNAGRTSLTLALARILSEDPALRLVIVDADFANPDVAKTLSLDAQTGLWNAASDREQEAAPFLTRLTDSLSVVPLVEAVPIEWINRERIAALQSFLRSVRRGSDLVLVDAGPWESLVPPMVFESRAIDAFLSVCRSDTPHDERPEDLQSWPPGLEWLGIVETFVPAPSGDWPSGSLSKARLPDRRKPELRTFAP